MILMNGKIIGLILFYEHMLNTKYGLCPMLSRIIYDTQSVNFSSQGVFIDA